VNDLPGKLSGGDRRSIGRADGVAREISAHPKLFSQAFEAVLSSDPVVRMRAVDAIEKATRNRPELLRPYKRTILKKIAAIDQQEVCWHVALMLPRLNLTSTERDLAVSILLDYLEHKSSIVRTCAMQGLAELAMENAQLRKHVIPLLQSLTENGTAAMRARGRKLLAHFKRRPAQP
jgi:HEAT repeat protein